MRIGTWQNSEEIRIVSTRVRTQSFKRQFLVFIVPSSSIASPLLSVLNAERNFDIAVRFYDDPGANDQFLTDADFVMTGGLSKFHAASQFLRSNEFLSQYDGYLFLDGDLEFNASQLSAFLAFVNAANLDLAQPSVTRDSYCYWKMAYQQQGFVFREASFVEVMAPYMSRFALSKLLPTFEKSISTYGLDLVWPSLVGNKAIAVVDAFQVRHRDRVDHASGSFYRYLKSIDVDLEEDERLMLAEYGVKREQAHSRRGYFWRRQWPLFGGPSALVSVPLGGPEGRTNEQFLIDLAMRAARMRRGRLEAQLEMAISPYLSGDRISAVISDGNV